jgi:hypothetical protein
MNNDILSTDTDLLTFEVKFTKQNLTDITLLIKKYATVCSLRFERGFNVKGVVSLSDAWIGHV